MPPLRPPLSSPVFLLPSSILNRDVYALALGALPEAFHQQAECAARVEHHAHFAVLAHQDAAACVLGSVAGVYAYALEQGHLQ